MFEDKLNTPKAKKILAERQGAIAQQKTSVLEESNEKILLFKLDARQYYAMPYKQIEKVIAYQAVTAIPGAASEFLGAIYYNTEVWPVIDSKKIFNLPVDVRISSFILCRDGSFHTALGIYELLGSLPYQDNEELAHAAPEEKYIAGIYKTNIAIIDIKAIFRLLI